MHVDGLLVWWPAGTKQCIDETRKPVRFADHDIGVFAEFVLIQLPLEQLCRPANAAQRVFDLVRKLPDHLPPGAVLNQQRVLAADLRAPGYVRQLDE